MRNNETIESLDFRSITDFIKKYWLILSLSVFVSLSGAYILNKYSPKIYKVASSLIINVESGGLADASAQLLNEFGFISNNKSFANELQVLYSTPLINKAVEKLNYPIAYYEHDVFSRKELYKAAPFIVILDKNYPQPIGIEFFVEFIDEGTCKVSVNSKKVNIYSFVSEKIVQELEVFEFEETVKLDEYLYSDNLKFKILLNSSVELDELQNNQYSFFINTVWGVTNAYKNTLEILPPDLESSIAQIKLKTETPEKGIDFIDRLTESYITSELDKKRHTAIRTIEYINDQLSIVGDSLKRAEQNLQWFRSQNEVANISTQSGQFFEEMRELENQKAIIEVNKKYNSYIKKYFQQNEEFDQLIAPSAMGIDDPMLNNLIEELIRLNAERASFIDNNQGKSPYLKKINIRLENLLKMVSENIAYYDETNKIKLEDIDNRISKLNGEMRKLPATQTQLVGIEREFNVNDAIYTYLLEKRAEAEIAKASYQSDTEVVEPAQVVGFGPVSPNKKLNYLIALILGIILPVAFIRVIKLVQTSFYDITELENAIEFPVVSKIGHLNNKSVDNVLDVLPNSYIAENFRHLRVGVKYFINSEKSNTILFSSTISGEGKSFIALNTAVAIAKTDQKVVLLDFDLRKPTDNRNVKGKELGLTEYLSKQIPVEDIIHPTDTDGLFVIESGCETPNAGELVTSNQTAELFEYLKAKFDYILIDTPPLGLVSDGYVIMDYVDLTMFVTRLKRTPKREFKNLQSNILHKKMNTCAIINDVPLAKKKGYGYYLDNKVNK